VATVLKTDKAVFDTCLPRLRPTPLEAMHMPGQSAEKPVCPRENYTHSAFEILCFPMGERTDYAKSSPTRIITSNRMSIP